MKKDSLYPLDKFVKCYKIDSTPPLEVYKNFIRWFGTNIDIDYFDEFIKKNKREYELAVKAKKIWEKEFKETTNEKEV